MPSPAAVTVRQSRFWATNTTIVAAPGGCLLVDPGVYLDELRATAASLTGPVLAVVHTHAHWDHMLWAPELDTAGGLPAHFVTGGTRKRLDRDLAALRRLLVDAAAGREEGVEATEPWDPALVGRAGRWPTAPASPGPGPTPCCWRPAATSPATVRCTCPTSRCSWPATCSPTSTCPSPTRTTRTCGLPRSALDRLVALPQVATLVPGPRQPDRPRRPPAAGRRRPPLPRPARGRARRQRQRGRGADARRPHRRRAPRRPGRAARPRASVRALAPGTLSSPPAAPGR